MGVSVPLFEIPNGSRTCAASAALTGARCVNISGAPVGDLMQVGVPAAGASCIGVAAFDAVSGGTLTVHQAPGYVIPIECGTGGVTAGDIVQCDNTGKAILRVAGVPLGRAQSTAIAGDPAYVLWNPQHV